MPKNVIIIGGGGHAKVVIDCIRSCEDQVVGILDDRMEPASSVLGVPVLGKIQEYTRFMDCSFLIAIGNNYVRRKIAGMMQDVQWYTAIHPRATVSRYAQIGHGSVVLANAVINPDAKIGCHCIINTGAIVEHDNQLGDYVHISPAAALGGTVCIGECSHVGIGAAVRDNLVICNDCVIGAGAAVVKNISERGVYVGVPAYFKEKNTDPG